LRPCCSFAAPAAAPSYTLSLHDALPISLTARYPVFAALHATDLKVRAPNFMRTDVPGAAGDAPQREPVIPASLWPDLSSRERELDRKSTRLNSSHVKSSYAVFCLKTKIK